MTTWADLETELAQWSEQGRRAGLWWRDDDAVAPGPRLEQAIELSKSSGTPLALAVIPGLAEDALRDAVSNLQGVAFLVHGLKHQNHAPEGEKKAEFGAHRPVTDMLEAAKSAWQILSDRFPALARPVFVPPWNRIDAALASRLHEVGLRGLSRFGPSETGRVAVLENNCHLDLINWRGDRGFIGEAQALENLIAHLRARRLETVNAVEQTGVLSHHAIMNLETWDFLSELFARTKECDGAHWLTIDEVFSLP